MGRAVVNYRQTLQGFARKHQIIADRSALQTPKDRHQRRFNGAARHLESHLVAYLEVKLAAGLFRNG